MPGWAVDIIGTLAKRKITLVAKAAYLLISNPRLKPYRLYTTQ